MKTTDNPLDENGNVLETGDMVVVMDGTSHCFGLIGEIKPAGIIAPATATVARDKSIRGMEMPGVVQITLFPLVRTFPDQQHPLGRLSNVVKVTKPPEFIALQNKLKEEN